MTDPFDDDAPTTSIRLVDLYTATRPALLALIDSVAPHASRRPAEPVSAATLDAARPIFSAVRKICSREPGARASLELRPPLDWAGFATKLALAQSALHRFHTAYRDVDMATLTGYWRTPGAAESFLQQNGLDEND